MEIQNVYIYFAIWIWKLEADTELTSTAIVFCVKKKTNSVFDWAEQSHTRSQWAAVKTWLKYGTFEDDMLIIGPVTKGKEFWSLVNVKKHVVLVPKPRVEIRRRKKNPAKIKNFFWRNKYHNADNWYIDIYMHEIRQVSNKATCAKNNNLLCFPENRT